MDGNNDARRSGFESSKMYSILSPLIGLNELLERAVIGFLDIVRKAAGRQLVHAYMIMQAFTASALARTPFIGAITVFYILIKIAIHNSYYIYIV